MSYQPAVYRAQGGNELVLNTSTFQTDAGLMTVKSGAQIDIESGGHIDLESGGYLSVESGGYIDYASGAYTKVPIQTLSTTQTATNITNFGHTRLNGTTTGPTYTLAAPVVGVTKSLFLNASSSGATHRALVRSNSTGVSFDTTGGNQLTLATSALRGISLVALTTAAWNIVGVYSGVSIAAPRTT